MRCTAEYTPTAPARLGEGAAGGMGLESGQVGLRSATYLAV